MTDFSIASSRAVGTLTDTTCLFAALSELVTTYGEDATARYAEGLSKRVANGEFSIESFRQ